jgi:endonuclease/exonuclease/phosphatase family metal-dependent hydrolase
MLLIISMLILAAVLYVGGMFLLAFATQYNPAPVEDMALVNPKSSIPGPKVLSDSTYTFLIWNLGYGGLGKEVDYFYDGGKMVTSPKEHVLKNNKGMVDFLLKNKEVDFVMLQEADRNSKRSWKIDQVEQFAKVLPEHNYAFAPNYEIRYLPFPFLDPIGKVDGGLQTLSKFTPVEIKRIALSNITDFPRRLFYLKRCLLLERYKLDNGKDLVIINTHFEAYDAGGLVKKEQRAETKKILDEEYAKGNYVVLGGDWNIAPPGFNVRTWDYPKITDELYLMNNDSIYVPGWKYVYDPTTASNRKNDFAYVEGKTYKTIIDYFYLSPNIEVEEVHGVDLGFDYSDHNPVKMRIWLK